MQRVWEKGPLTLNENAHDRTPFGCWKVFPPANSEKYWVNQPRSIVLIPRGISRLSTFGLTCPLLSFT